MLAGVKEAAVAGGAAKDLDDADIQAVVAPGWARGGRHRVRRRRSVRAGPPGSVPRARCSPATCWPLTDDELDGLVSQVLAAGGYSSPQDMGPAVKAVQAEVAGRRDGKAVGSLVKTPVGGVNLGRTSPAMSTRAARRLGEDHPPAGREGTTHANPTRDRASGPAGSTS